jgi:hypothetical protein
VTGREDVAWIDEDAGTEVGRVAADEDSIREDGFIVAVGLVSGDVTDLLDAIAAIDDLDLLGFYGGPADDSGLDIVEH